LLLYANEKAILSASKEETAQRMAAYASYIEAMKKAGAFVGANRLQPTSTATTVRAPNGKSSVLDGPYAETKEQLRGYFLIEAPDLDAALSWAARCPGAGHGAIEVRPVWMMLAPGVPREKAKPARSPRRSRAKATAGSSPFSRRERATLPAQRMHSRIRS